MAEQEKKEEKTVTLDGKPVSQDQLQEVKAKTNVRLHQENETTFRTLHRMTE